MIGDQGQKAVDRVSDLPSEIQDKPKFTELNSEEFPAIELAIIGSNEGRHRDKIVDLVKDELEDILINYGLLS